MSLKFIVEGINRSNSLHSSECWLRYCSILLRHLDGIAVGGHEVVNVTMSAPFCILCVCVCVVWRECVCGVTWVCVWCDVSVCVVWRECVCVVWRECVWCDVSVCVWCNVSVCVWVCLWCDVSVCVWCDVSVCVVTWVCVSVCAREKYVLSVSSVVQRQTVYC